MAATGKARQTVAWYAKRLRVMRPSEVVHRASQQWLLAALYVRHFFGAGRKNSHVVPGFSFCTAKAAQLPNLSWLFSPEDESMQTAASGRHHALGSDWCWRPEEEVWHAAPESRMRWPRIFFGLIPYRDGNPYGDIRLIWEPARLQQCVTLALLIRTAQGPLKRQAQALLEAQLLSWSEANSPFTGVHYISAMECGLRLIAVCHALDMAREGVSDRLWRVLLELVESHAWLISKRVSKHSSAGNHTVAEAAALVYAGALFPEMPGAAGWSALGLALLEKEADHQILPDGGPAEQAFWYHRFTLDLYGLVAALLKHRRLPVPPHLSAAYLRGQAFLHAFGDAYDTLPRIGDSDNGFALSPHVRLSIRWALPPDGLRTFKDSGYSVIHGRCGSGQLIFDHGSLGMPPCYGHGHADALAVQLRLGGSPILIDPGTYRYAGEPRWRAYFRGTRAHNTVTVDGQDQAVQESAFLWSQPYRGKLIAAEQSPSAAIRVLANHDGYRKRLGVMHWRAVIYQPPGCWIIWDYLSGHGVHDLELSWHLGFDPIQTGRYYILPIAGWPVTVTVEGGAVSVHRGECDPIRGWKSDLYGIKEPTSTLVCRYRGTLPHEFVTRLWVDARPEEIAAFDEDVEIVRKWMHATATN